MFVALCARSNAYVALTPDGKYQQLRCAAVATLPHNTKRAAAGVLVLVGFQRLFTFVSVGIRKPRPRSRAPRLSSSAGVKSLFGNSTTCSRARAEVCFCFHASGLPLFDTASRTLDARLGLPTSYFPSKTIHLLAYRYPPTLHGSSGYPSSPIGRQHPRDDNPVASRRSRRASTAVAITQERDCCWTLVGLQLQS